VLCALRGFLLNPQTAGPVPYLDVIFQHSCNDGQSWSDVAHVSTVNNHNYYCYVSLIAPGSTSVSAIQDGTLAANTLLQGPIGDRVRVKYKVTPGSRGSYSTIRDPSEGSCDGGSSLLAPTGYHGPSGNRCRMRYNATLGTSTGPWAFQVYVLPHLNPIKDHMQ
jgi:hypothetical protein